MGVVRWSGSLKADHHFDGGGAVLTVSRTADANWSGRGAVVGSLAGPVRPPTVGAWCGRPAVHVGPYHPGSDRRTGRSVARRWPRCRGCPPALPRPPTDHLGGPVPPVGGALD